VADQKEPNIKAVFRHFSSQRHNKFRGPTFVQVVCIATKLQDGGFGVRILVEAGDISVTVIVQTRCEAHPSSCSITDAVLSLG
jgi:hypothetical protein